MVAICGYRPVDGALFYTNNRNYEITLLDLRSRMLEGQNIRTRQSYKVTARNYGNIEEEMFAEQTQTVNTPNSNAAFTNNGLGAGNYSHVLGTPLFLEQHFASSDRYVGLVATGSNATTIRFGTTSSDVYSQMHVGEEIEVNGELRTVTAFTAPTATAAGSITVSGGFSATPDIGSLIMIKGRDYVNPHQNEFYRVTDKYGSYTIDNNRYQVDREHGLIRYRPNVGTVGASTDPRFSYTNSVWHPSYALATPFYFGKMVPVRTVPPPAGPGPVPGPDDGVTGNEQLGAVDDSVASGSNPTVTIAGPAVLTGFTAGATPSLVAPDGEYSNVRVSAPEGIPFTVELNGAILAVSDGSPKFDINNNPVGNSVIIPFFDPNFENDQQKANEGADPDVYIQRFIKTGDNVWAIKATENNRNAAGTPIANAFGRGLRIEGTFNGTDLETGAIAASLTGQNKPHASVSVKTLDWSASRNSILGIVGKVDFDLGDRIALEDVNDEVQKMQGVLESLTTLIAGTDLNQFQSMLSVFK